jgi:hypothetical protein
MSVTHPPTDTCGKSLEESEAERGTAKVPQPGA